MMLKKTLSNQPGTAAQDLKTTVIGHSSIAEYACSSVAPEDWREPLDGELPVLHLPTDHPRPAIPTPGSGQHRLMLPEHLINDFKRLSREEGSTLFIALLAAFKTLLYRYTGQTEIVVGTSVTGCAQGDLEGLIGRFANLLPLRTTLSGDLSFKELLGRVHQTYENGHARRDVPFERLAEKLQPEHKSSAAPLLSVMFDMYREPPAALNLPGFSIQNIEAEPQFTNLDVVLTLEETEHGLEAIFVYRRELFEAETVQRMAEHYRKLIEEMCGKPEARLAELSLPGQEERHQLLYEWNETQREFPSKKCLHELFEEQVERAPEATAVMCGNQRLSYAELHSRSNRVARYLESRGVGAETCVGVWLERGVELVVAVLGVLKAGAAYVPIEAGAPVERVQYMLEDAEARVLLTQQRLSVLRVLHDVEVVCLDTDPEVFVRQSDRPLHNRVTLDNPAYVIYTSGSTGKPKGVPNTHRGLLNLVLWYRDTFHVTAEDRTTQLVRVAFDATMLELWPYLSAGASIHFPDEETRLSPQALRDWLIAQHITISFLPTPLAEKMMFLEWPAKLSLRFMLTGGDRLHMPPPTDLPFTVVNNYGPSESSVITTSATIAPVNQSTTLPPIGRVVSNAQAYVLDSYLQPVPMNVIGELYVGGAGLARGYLRRPALTAESFIPHPYSSEAGARLYRTGDLVRYLPDGNLDFVGRTDHQVKIRGYRIELGEIESALNSHPSVRESVVMARNGASGDKQLVAYVAIDKALEVTAVRLQTFLKEQLPDYMIPGAFVFLDALPLSPNGKVDRRALPVPERTHSALSENYVAPRSADERQLAEIWSEVLRVDRVGVNDNFFELGGHSLLAAQVSSRARNIFKVDLPLYIFLQASTVAELADAISQQRAAMAEGEVLLSTLPEIVHDPENSFEPFPLSDVQQAYWLGRSGAFEFGNVTSHIYFEFESRGLDLPRLNAAWQRLILRHPMLRAIVRDDGLQQILPHTPPFTFDLADLRALPPAEVDRRLLASRRLLSHQLHVPDRWPLFSVKAHLLDDRRLRLCLNIDLLIIDGHSLRLLFHEWELFYRDPALSPPPLELSFRDYLLADLAAADTPQRRLAESYWLARLETLPPAPQLPLAQHPAAITRPRFTRQNTVLDPHTHQTTLEREVWERVKERARRRGLTPSVVLCAAYAAVLARWSKSARLTINLTAFNRQPVHRQINEVVGDFTTLTLLEVDAQRAENFEALAARLQEQLWQDLERREYGAVKVLRALARREEAGGGGGGGGGARMPVVFTSLLEDFTVTDWLGETTYSLTNTPQVWLDHVAMERKGALSFHWDAVEELFPEGMVREMFAAYLRLLEGLGGEEADGWTRREMVELAEAQVELVARLNATQVAEAAGEADELLHAGFKRQARARAGASAIITEARELSYGEVADAAQRVAQWLGRRGVRRNELVGVVMEKGWEQVVAVLGVLESGGAYLPIDAELPAQRVEYLLRQGEVRLVVTQSRVEGRVRWPEGLDRLAVDRLKEADGESDNGDGHDIESGEQRAAATDLAYVIFTSGSTGHPKGVMIDHRGALNTIRDINRRFRVTPADRVLALSSLSFDLSVYDIFGTLGAGGCIVMPEASATREPRVWAALVEKHAVSIWNTVPALMELLVEEVGAKNGTPLKPASETQAASALRTLRLVLLSGDWIAVSLPARLRAVAPRAEVVSLGGATEASIWSILYPIDEVRPEWKSIPYGHPMANQRFYVLNERMEHCPLWVTGQLYIGGVGLAQGYWRDESRTEVSFIRHEATGERLYRTGDLGRYRGDGEIEFLGREDTQVKVQGHRIELGEVEAALEEHEGVRQAVVVAVGERDADRRLVGYVVRAGGALAAGALREHLRRKVPEYMVPGVIMEVAEMPLTGNGKVNRQALPAPDGALLEIARHYVAPRDLIEERTANLCAQLLKVERVGVYDDFFWLGGNSLSAIQLIAKLRDEFEVELPVSKIFLDPNVAGLALAILNGLVEKEDEEQMRLLLDELERLPEEELDTLLQQGANKTAEGKDYE